MLTSMSSAERTSQVVWTLLKLSAQHLLPSLC